MSSSSSWNFWRVYLFKHKYTLHAQTWAILRLQRHYKAYRYLTQLLVFGGMSSTCLYSARPQCVSWPSYIVFRGIWLTVLPLWVLFIKNNTESSQGITACDVNMKHQLCMAQIPWEVSETLWDFHFRNQNSKHIPFSHIYHAIFHISNTSTRHKISKSIVWTHL